MIRKIIRYFIKCADAELIETLLDAVYKRKEELFPEWEIIYVALPRKSRDERRGYLEWMLRMESERGNV